MDDLIPPPVPGAPTKKKTGFFSKLFKKKASSIDDIRLNDIKDNKLKEIREKAAGGSPGGANLDNSKDATGANIEREIKPAMTSGPFGDSTKSSEPASSDQEYSFKNAESSSTLEIPEPEPLADKLPPINDNFRNSSDSSETLNNADSETDNDAISQGPIWDKDNAISKSEGSLWDKSEPKSSGETNIADSGGMNKNAQIDWTRDDSTGDYDYKSKVEGPLPTFSDDDTSKAGSYGDDTLRSDYSEDDLEDEDIRTLREIHKGLEDKTDESSNESIIKVADDSDPLTDLDLLNKDIASAENLENIGKSAGSRRSSSKRNEEPPHHEEIKKIFDSISKKHEKLDNQLARLVDDSIKVPEWKYQKREVPPDKYFKLKNGQEIRNFKDLLEALNFIDDETFKHHVTEERNDFAEWVEHVLQEEKLAEQIRNKKAREELIKILNKHEKKVFNELKKQVVALEKELDKKQKKVKRIRDLEAKIKALNKDLEIKSRQLSQLRGEMGKKLKEKLDNHINNSLSEAKEKLRSRENILKERESALSLKEKELLKKETDLKLKEELLNKKEAEIESAKKVLEKAEEVIRDKKETLKAKEENKKLLMLIKEETKNSIKSKKEAEKALKKLEKEKAKLTKEKEVLSSLKKELNSREKSLLMRERSLEKKTSDLEPRLKDVEDREKAFKAMSKQELAILASKRKEVEELTAELKKKMAQDEKLLKMNREVLKKIEAKRKEIIKREKELEKHGFRSYLEGRLNETVSGEFSDVPDVDSISNVKLYRLIDKCKELLEKKDLAAAKKTYNTLRSEFSKSKLSSHEKSIIYNEIRELYDDIHLAMLNG